MSAPQRIQLKRTKGWRMPPDTVRVSRGKMLGWGNPCRVGMFKDYSADDAVRNYRLWIDRDLSVRSFEIAFGIPPTHEKIREALHGKNLACWCPLDQPCHADVLLEIANS